MWVVKLGGSLLTSDSLAQWLTLIEEKGDGKVIIVPGGSVFANAVRHADQAVNLTDACAHRLAVMAMDQYAYVLKDLAPGLTVARHELEIAERGWQHRGIIWLPSHMLLADENIPHSWSVTSDTLAAWLAKKLNATNLVLVKSIRSSLPLDSLIAAEVIDDAFSSAVAGAKFNAWTVHKNDYEHFASGFNQDTLAQVGNKLL